MRFSQVLVFLFFLLLPAGWAKHWIVPNSLVNGVLVDYLMPDVWLQDLIAVILTTQILLTRNWKFAPLKLKYLISPRVSGVNFTAVISGLLVLISVILSPIPLISAVNFLRFLLAVGTAWVIYNNKDLHKPALLGLSGAVVWTSILALGQFLNQATVIGWQFLGEPIFTSGSGGVKKIFLFGRELVAPMATFPHANVMGAFGLLAYLVLTRRHSEVETSTEESLDDTSAGGILRCAQDDVRNVEDNAFLRGSKWLSLILIFLSFSLPVWLITLYLFIRKLRSVYTSLILGVLGVIGLRVAGYAFPITSLYRRLDLTKHALTMIKNHPFFGVGWGGFVRKLPPATFLQPVHNIFLLVLSELGVVGAGGLVLVVRSFFKNIEFKKYLLLTTCYLILFSIDHYFWTTTQGIYMLWVMISLF